MKPKYHRLRRIIENYIDDYGLPPQPPPQRSVVLTPQRRYIGNQPCHALPTG